MATIRMREHLDGTFAYQAVVRIKQQGKIVYRESKVFSKHQSAVNWAKRREVELQDPVELARARASRKTLAELIRWYIDQFSEISVSMMTSTSELSLVPSGGRSAGG